MLHGETTKRSELDPERLTAKLQAHGVARLRGEQALWVVFDGSDRRQPHAAQMEHLQRVKRLDGDGLVNGYRTLNAIGMGGGGRRGLLYHRLFSSHAPDFLSEPHETRAAVRSVGAALAPLVAEGAEVTDILDSGVDDVAVWAEVWGQGHRLVCRLQHRDRLVRPAPGAPICHLADVAPKLVDLAAVATELVVRKVGQERPKLQPVTATVAAVPLVVAYREEARTRPDGAERERACWLVEVRLEKVAQEPWWLLTDRPVETAEQATEVFRMVLPALGDRGRLQGRQDLPGLGGGPGPGRRRGPPARRPGLGGGRLPLRARRHPRVGRGPVAAAPRRRRGPGRTARPARSC